MPTERLSLFKAAFVSKLRSVERLDHGWSFAFGEGVYLRVGVPWRIVTSGGIAFADTDDGQKFGLPQPVDGQHKANELLDGRRVVSFNLDERTADIQVMFEGDLRLELFNNSGGYEGWSAGVKAEGFAISVTGLGGGDVAIW